LDSNRSWRAVCDSFANIFDHRLFGKGNTRNIYSTDARIAGYLLVCVVSQNGYQEQKSIPIEARLMERGFHKAGDVENRLGYYVGQLGA
jgi:hypothetical protein